MKKWIIASLLFVPTVLLTGCTTTTYYPSYNSDYVYSVGYYGYRPAWNYYSGYGWGNTGHWSGYRNYYGYGGYHRGWHGRRW